MACPAFPRLGEQHLEGVWIAPGLLQRLAQGAVVVRLQAEGAARAAYCLFLELAYLLDDVGGKLAAGLGRGVEDLARHDRRDSGNADHG
jgi:hypothetical protein